MDNFNEFPEINMHVNNNDGGCGEVNMRFGPILEVEGGSAYSPKCGNK